MSLFTRVSAFVVTSALLAFAVSAASAQTAAEAAAQWGLLGTWKLDCSKQASTNDPDLIFVVRQGRLIHDRNWGDGRDSSPVVSAGPSPDDGFRVRARFDSLSQTREWIYTRGSDGRIRSVSNRDVDTDKYTVRDGVITANGNPTAWQTRCR